jgi:hypothetical protein
LHLDRAWPEAWEAEEYRLETLLDDHHLQAVEAMVETAVMMVTMNHLRMVTTAKTTKTKAAPAKTTTIKKSTKAKVKMSATEAFVPHPGKSRCGVALYDL